MKKRLFSFFLALVMMFSCLSLNVFAQDEGEAPQEAGADSIKGGRLTSAELINKVGAENVIADIDFTGMKVKTQTF